MPPKVNNGRRLLEYSIWLNRMILQHGPDTFIIETPIMGGHRANVAATKLLFGLYAVAQILAAKHSLRFLETYPISLKKWFTGSGKAQKPQMIAECRRRGWDVTDDNAADALALVAFAESQI